MGFFEISKTVIKSALGKPATLMYPAKPAKKFEISRGHVVNDIKRCIYCGSCQRKCPTKAICVDMKERTWEIDKFRCVVCNVCVEVCPVKCLSMDTQYTAPAEKKTRELMKGPPKAPKPEKEGGEDKKE